jgi:predicted TIM-barrel fold metal-dependent hydrolase
MNSRANPWKPGPILGLAAAIILASGVRGLAGPPASTPPSGATVLEQLERMPKIDAHAHVAEGGVADEKRFIDLLKRHNVKWLDICVVGTDWGKLRKKIAFAESLHQRYPRQVAWAGSFNLENWGRDGWRKAALETIEQSFAHGAVAIKVWKEIGMVIKDPDGRWVMIDDPRFDPLFDYIEGRNKTLVGHIGEPRNCWLPLESMTVASDHGYYKEHPQYHGFLHPEVPGYWEQIKARDHVLEKHPRLRFVGCHLGSLEYDVEELARRLDKYPNFAVDTAERIVHFQVQDREKVRKFLVKYQDRILYGTDCEIGLSGPADFEARMKRFDHIYRQDYRYFATDGAIEVPEVKPGFTVRGLELPLPVLKKIFYENALKWYPGID